MKLRPTIILFLFAAALAAYFFLAEQPRRRAAQREAALARTLSAVPVESVASVVIEQGNEILHLKKKRDRWVVTDPLEDVADHGAVNVLIASIAEAQIDRKILGETNLSNFGLDPAQAYVSLISAGGDTLFELAVGNHTLDKRWVYAMRRGESEVLLVTPGIRRYALRPAQEFRDNRVVRFTLEEVESYWVSSLDGPMGWQRLGAGWFHLAGPDTLRGDTGAVEALLRRTRALRAFGFPPSGDELRDRFRRGSFIAMERRGSPGLLRLTMGAPWESGLLAAVDTVEKWDDALRWPPARVVMVDSIATLIFSSSVAALRDLSVFHFEAVALGRFELRSSDTTATLTKVGDEWAHLNPALGRLDQGPVRRFINALAGLKFNTIVSERANPELFDEATHVITVFDKKGGELDRLSGLPGGDDAHLLVTSASSRVVGHVEKESWDALFAALRAIKPRQP